MAEGLHEDPHESRASIGRSMGRWRVLIGRRVLARLAIDTIAPDLEITHLDVLDAVRRPSLTPRSRSARSPN